MLDRLSVASPALVSVKDNGTLTVLTIWLPNVREAGEVLATGAIPVPVRLTVGAAPEVLLFKVRTPFRLPRVVGVNVTLTEQVAPAARVVPQLLL